MRSSQIIFSPEDNSLEVYESNTIPTLKYFTAGGIWLGNCIIVPGGMVGRSVVEASDNSGAISSPNRLSAPLSNPVPNNL